MNESNEKITPEELRDFAKIESLYKALPFDQPSAKTRQAVVARAQKITGGRGRGFLWILQPRAVRFALMLVAALGIGLYYKGALDEPVRVVALQPLPNATMPPPAGLKMAQVAKEPPAGTDDENEIRGEAANNDEDTKTITDHSGFVASNGLLKEAAYDSPVEHNVFAPAKPDSAPAVQEKGIAMIDAAQLFKEAQSLQAIGKHKEAEALYRRIWDSKEPFAQKAGLLYNWAVCLHQLGNNAEALAKLDLLSLANPDYPELEQLRALIQNNQP